MNNFTPRAQQALALARKEAEACHHREVGTEDLLVGLIRLGAGVAVTVLTKLGLDLEAVRAAVAKLERPAAESQGQSPLPYAQGVKITLVLAAKHARALSHSYIGTEHILLGLLGDTDGPAGRVLQSFKVDLDRTRKAILEELTPGQISLEALSQFRPGWIDLSPEAVRTLALADGEARRLHHNYIGTEHLLLGLIRLGSGVAMTALRKQGIELEALQKTMDRMVAPGTPAQSPANIPYTPRTKKTLTVANREAELLQHAKVGPEHLLLAMLRDNEGVAWRALKACNVDFERTRAAILEELGPGSGKA